MAARQHGALVKAVHVIVLSFDVPLVIAPATLRSCRVCRPLIYKRATRARHRRESPTHVALRELPATAVIDARRRSQPLRGGPRGRVERLDGAVNIAAMGLQ